jgi:ATP-binding cassette subfamily B protein
MTRSLASAERIFALLDSPGEKEEDPAAVRLPRVKGKIEFREVRFSYERGKEVLKGISFTIEAGEMIGLVGKSGAGKSTLINLISRFWDPDSGAVLVDGHDLREMDVSMYRRQVGVVMQDPFLFNCSLLENIRFGMPEASFEDVVRAAQAAHAHDFILGKEDGYDTVVGEKGAELSGGERQRIAIARAILHDPPILILDEATSSVDLETEKKIQEAITRLVKGRTTIAIAHRLSTLRNASRLIVMDDGVLAEMGTHDELVAKEGGMYAKLVKTQAEVNAMRGHQRVWDG